MRPQDKLLQSAPGQASPQWAVPCVLLVTAAPAVGVPAAKDPSQPLLYPLPDLVHFEVPSIHVELGSTLRLSPLEHARRHSVTEKRNSEEESESTAL